MVGTRGTRPERLVWTGAVAAAGFILVACSGTAPSASTTAPQASQASVTPSTTGCVAPEAAQFDFWVGTWKGTWADSGHIQTASDTIVRSGCEIDETFAAAFFLGHTNYTATSKSHWDSSFGMWVQDYADNVGERSRWLGSFAKGQMVLVGPEVGSRQQRVIWRDIRVDGWVWEYDSSVDGASWNALAVIPYTRAR
jgi:hypothetical protein